MMDDEEMLEANAHIPDAEILADIYDTEREILQLNREVKEREEFILKLKRLLELRDGIRQ